MVENVRRPLALALVVLVVLSGFTALLPQVVADFPAPVANAGSDQTVRAGEDVVLNASASFDINNDTLTYTWDFDSRDGTDQVDGTGVEVTTVYENTGIYTVTLTVSDGQFEDTDTCRITVLPTVPDNAPPKAIITAPLPGVYNVSEAIDFSGTGYDADGDNLFGKWNFGDGSTSTYPDVSHAYSREGAKYVRWMVSDGKANNTARTVIFIGQVVSPDVNRRPSAVITYQTTNISKGSKVWFSGQNSTDPDDDNLTYEWDFNLNDGLQVQSTAMKVWWVFNSTGSFTVSLQVRDGKLGGWSIATLDVTVREVPNDPPVASAGNDAEIQMGVSLVFKGTATDPDGDNITLFHWDFGDGTNWESASTGTTNHTYSQVGTFTATLTVTDEHGATDSDTRNVVVKAPPDQPPTADAGPDLTIMEGDTAHFQGSGEDDFGIALYEWDFNSDGVWEYSSPYSGDATWTYEDPGVFTAILRVRENNRPGVPGPGQTTTDSCVVTVRKNNAPDAKIRVDTMFVSCGEIVRFRSESTDPESGRLTYAWDLDGDGTTDSSVSNPSYVYRTGGNYQVTLTVTDDHGQTDSDMVTMQVSQTFGVTLEAVSAVYEAEPGERHDFRMTLTNTGNGDDMLRITIAGGNSGWASLDSSMVGLNSSDRQTVTLTVRVPSTALSTDEAKLTVTASSTYGTASASQTIEVSVRQRFSLKATIDVRELSMGKGENKEGAVKVTITNDGNGPDTFRVTFSGDIAAFLTSSTPKVDLVPGETKEIDLNAFVIDSTKSGEYKGTVTVASTKSGSKQSFDFTLTVKSEPEPIWKTITSNWLFLAIIVVVLAVVVGLMASTRRNRTKPSRG
jgi:PKD repeat protein